MIRTALLAATGIVAVILLGACEPIAGNPPRVAASAQTRATHEIGRQIYNFRCYYCHGYSGDARTLAATFLAPAPRDFSASFPGELPRERMIDAITRGRAGTAMKGYAGTLTQSDISVVADFIVEEFMRTKSPNTRYHTEANGWRDHERFAIAFPFAKGEIALDAPAEALSAAQRQGKQLFMNACISCHDRAKINSEGPAWAIRPVTYPPDFYLLAESGRATENAVFDPHHRHEQAPLIRGLTRIEKRGELLYQRNCAFCHAADGTGRNWIGSFLEPNAADLTSARISEAKGSIIAAMISAGIDGTSMPAWKHVLTQEEINALAAYVSRAFSDSGSRQAQRPG